MLKARRKITHKEIKKDKLVTSYFQVRTWFDKPENRKRVGMAAGIVVILVIAVFLYISNRKTKNEKAETKLSMVKKLTHQGNNTVPAGKIPGSYKRRPGCRYRWAE